MDSEDDPVRISAMSLGVSGSTRQVRCGARPVSGGLNPRKSGGGKWWRNMVTESGGHLWRRILVAAFGAECATNSKG
ncbi:hypothetical protein, partial [Hydrogenophaga sp.]|uniref:hypothetical protein n=1 Tax=Hydrogenophaga sp. TaxID=1904254 RepID=UPI00273306F5